MLGGRERNEGDGCWQSPLSVEGMGDESLEDGWVIGMLSWAMIR